VYADPVGLRRDMAVLDPPRSPLLLPLITLVVTLTSSVNVVAAGTFSVSSAPGRGSPTDPLSPTIEPLDATGGEKALVGTPMRIARTRISHV